jgi:hypothetical protein
VATSVLVGITGIYAWRTHVMSKATVERADANKRMADEMKSTNDMQQTPSIIAYFENPMGDLIDLVVKMEAIGQPKKED